MYQIPKWYDTRMRHDPETKATTVWTESYLTFYISLSYRLCFSYIVAVSFICGVNRSTWKKAPTWRKSLSYILWLSFPYEEYTIMTLSRSEVCAHFHVFKSVAYLRYLTVSDYPLGIFTLSLIQRPGCLNELVVGIPNNSDKPITNTALYITKRVHSTRSRKW
jgi:hypothetical protein